MSEQHDFDHLTDEDLEAIERIVEGSLERQHGQDLLAVMDGAEERHEEQARSLLDAISQATMAQEESEQE